VENGLCCGLSETANVTAGGEILLRREMLERVKALKLSHAKENMSEEKEDTVYENLG